MEVMYGSPYRFLIINIRNVPTIFVLENIFLFTLYRKDGGGLIAQRNGLL